MLISKNEHITESSALKSTVFSVIDTAEIHKGKIIAKYKSQFPIPSSHKEAKEKLKCCEVQKPTYLSLNSIKEASYTTRLLKTFNMQPSVNRRNYVVVKVSGDGFECQSNLLERRSFHWSTLNALYFNRAFNSTGRQLTTEISDM
ncbi:hypothetical protein Y032_0065g3598 [Ancylostoma ceylanicum]|uniref:Uncharacterized protein n=1 Tax=Ancylostoma ceylanicum TaxID=53326 RepID=A0A016U0R2_9BILA|nr:hypothetical protein Y032_0065g3598 [Ancylostoma ceylanicum]